MANNPDRNKVILVLSDGLRYDTAVSQMGYLGHMVETQQASFYKVIGELPSLSLPVYEALHTGLSASQHGIVSNAVRRASNRPNIFQLARDAGKTTAAVAYSWFSELYNHFPYHPIDDKEVDDESLAIQHGRFYTEDSYPDMEVFTAAASLIKKYLPDYLLVHPMGMDYIGESFGGDSSQYRKQAILQDALLAPLIATWFQLGYTVLVTSDHGMSKDGTHGGTTTDEREVPLFIIHPKGLTHGQGSEAISQLKIAPTILQILAVPGPENIEPPLIVKSDD